VQNYREKHTVADIPEQQHLTGQTASQAMGELASLPASQAGDRQQGAILALDREHRLALSIQDLIGKCIAVLGITGFGKTNTAAVLIEELLSQGLPLTIVDIESEYYGLKQSYQVLVAGRSIHAEVPLEMSNAASLAEISIRRGISVILDLADYTQDEASTILTRYFKRLWEVASIERKPYEIVLEECHEWIPQSVSTPLKQILTRIALRGRKRGLGTILLSQRSAKVEKDVLTQASLLFLHKVMHPTDMRVYKEVIPLPGQEVEALVNSLQVGQALLVDQRGVQAVHLRQRHTYHAGDTPAFGIEQPPLLRIDEQLLGELQALLGAAQQEDQSEALLLKRIRTLEQTLAEKEAEIETLRRENDLLSRLRVEFADDVPGLPTTLEIEQAVIKRLVAEGKLVQPVPVASPSTPAAAQPRRMSGEQHELQAFLRRLHQLSVLHQRLLRVFIDYDDSALSLAQLAKKSGYARTTLERNPPHTLLELQLVSRYRMRNGGLGYRSHIRETLRRTFPNHDPEELLQQFPHSNR
jgi:hypothetical protein